MRLGVYAADSRLITELIMWSQPLHHSLHDPLHAPEDDEAHMSLTGKCSRDSNRPGIVHTNLGCANPSIFACRSY